MSAELTQRRNAGDQSRGRSRLPDSQSHPQPHPHPHQQPLAASSASGAFVDPSLMPNMHAPLPLVVAPRPYPPLAPTVLSGLSRYCSARLLAQWAIIFASLTLAGEGAWRVHIALLCFVGYGIEAWHESLAPPPPALPVGLPAPPAPRKSLVVSYVLWLLTGFMGGHHLYLGRDTQAVLWATSCGGFFAGWIRDAWRMPEYVRWANASLCCFPSCYAQERLARDGESKDWIYRRLVVEYCSMTSPAFVRRPPRASVAALLGQMLVAVWLGELCGSTFELLQPDVLPPFPTLAAAGGSLSGWVLAMTGRVHLLRILSALLRAVGIALGTTLIGNARPMVHCGFLRVFLGTAAAHAGALYLSLGSSAFLSRTLVCAVAALVFHSNQEWSLASRQMIHAAQRSSPMMPGPLVQLPPELLDRPTSPLLAAHPPPAPTPCSYWIGPLPRRLMRATLWATLLLFLTSSFLLNVGIDEHGTPLKTVLRTRLSDPSTQAWIHAAQAQWHSMRDKGWERYWADLMRELDAEGIDSSYRILGFSDAEIEATTEAEDEDAGAEEAGAGAAGISASQLRKRRNALALRFHPDKQGAAASSAGSDDSTVGDAAGSCDSVESCEIRFAEVQRAYERIVAHRKQRAESQEQNKAKSKGKATKPQPTPQPKQQQGRARRTN